MQPKLATFRLFHIKSLITMNPEFKSHANISPNTQNSLCYKVHRQNVIEIESISI